MVLTRHSHTLSLPSGLNAIKLQLAWAWVRVRVRMRPPMRYHSFGHLKEVHPELSVLTSRHQRTI
jgi:hypothetical protein